MDSLTLDILVLGSLVSLWLVYYVRFRLPAKLDDRFINSMRAFSTAVELRIPSQKGMTDQVVSLCKLVARKMDLPDKSRRDLEMAAMLRDIGLCAIPYGMMNGKSEVDWTEAERLTFDRHAEVSGAMLEMVPSLQGLAPFVRWHHVPYEGDPQDRMAPRGESIPLEARILKVVGEYVSLERTRGNLLARETLNSQSGTAYDPEVVSALLEVLTSPRARQFRTFAHA